MADHGLNGRRRVSDNQNKERGRKGEEVKTPRGSVVEGVSRERCR